MAIKSKAIIEMLGKNHRDCCEPPEEFIKPSDVNEAREKNPEAIMSFIPIAVSLHLHHDF